jgi:hypothetical protein
MLSDPEVVVVALMAFTAQLAMEAYGICTGATSAPMLPPTLLLFRIL